ncbi:MAG TPA: hypothetical protein VF894_15395 [Anaeromyxobacter sp.]
MEASIECTHCRVVMTSWSAPGSPIRYYQCPFCARTHSSLYGEVFRRRAGARVLDAPARVARPSELPMASQDEMRWARVKATASRWFARLEADERRVASGGARRPLRTAPAEDVPEVDPADVVELAPAVAGRKR